VEALSVAELDDLIHQPLRLKIMAALYAEREAEPLEFARLKAITQATDGNLGSHLATLEKAGYVEILKDYVGKRPRTRVNISAAGRKAFRRHVDYLREIVEASTATSALKAPKKSDCTRVRPKGRLIPHA
jgi:DNA-binding MarR family transcriptional regulator